MKRQVKSKPNHPYIERRRGYRGGRAIIAGTNFPVSSVATYIVSQGMLPEELVRTFPHLTLAQVHDALSYYYDHQAEIDDEMRKNLSEDALTVDLADGRTISVPLQWFPRLVHGTLAERARFELSFDGIHWPDLNEDISVEGLIAGRASGESQQSFANWLDSRAVTPSRRPRKNVRPSLRAAAKSAKKRTS